MVRQAKPNAVPAAIPSKINLGISEKDRVDAAQSPGSLSRHAFF
jgi:hypothetical protein